TLGLGGEIVPGVALEGNVRYGVVPHDVYKGRMVIELAILAGGYGWIFPKGDHVNVGVGGWASEGPLVRSRLRELCAAYGIDPDEVTELRGHRLPLRRPSTKLASRLRRPAPACDVARAGEGGHGRGARSDRNAGGRTARDEADRGSRTARRRPGPPVPHSRRGLKSRFAAADAASDALWTSIPFCGAPSTSARATFI